VPLVELFEEVDQFHCYFFDYLLCKLLLVGRKRALVVRQGLASCLEACLAERSFLFGKLILYNDKNQFSNFGAEIGSVGAAVLL
jgi:hypothetical protein